MKLINADTYSKVIQDYFSDLIEQGNDEIDILECNAELHKLIHHFIMPLGIDLSLGTPIEKIQVEIDIETLCQCTGLTDKNGNKIWESSIIKYNDEVVDKENIDLIVFNETHAGFLRLHSGMMGLQYRYINEALANGCEVIGNSFDNPELLEVKNE